MKSIEHYANLHRTDKRARDHNFAEFYEDKLRSLRDKPIKLLEFGVKFGSSTRMWEEAFPKAQCYAVDNAPRWRVMPQKTRFANVDLRDARQLQDFCQKHGPWDVVVDDSAHTSEVTRNIITTLWPTYIRSGGWLIVEDINSGYKTSRDPSKPIELHDHIDYCMSLVRNVCHSGKLSRCGPQFWELSSEFDKAIFELVYRPGIMGMQRR